MEYCTIGKSDLKVSRICIGTAQMSGDCDPAELEKLFTHALDRGVNFIDTARNYYGSEEILGRLLKSMRKKFIIATKFSGREFDYDTVKAQICESLKNLRTDYIDLYQIHWPKMKLLGAKTDMLAHDYYDIADTMHRLSREGLIRYAGLSNFRRKHLRNFKADALNLFVSDQVPYSLLWRVYDVDGTAEFCREHHISFLAYGPLAGGLLAGKYCAEDRAKNSNSVLFNEPVLTGALETIERIRKIVESSGCTIPASAIRWIMSKRIVAAAIAGMRTRQHLQENIDAVDAGLPEDLILEIDRISMLFQEKYLVPGLEQLVLWTEPQELNKTGIRMEKNEAPF